MKKEKKNAVGVKHYKFMPNIVETMYFDGSEECRDRLKNWLGKLFCGWHTDNKTEGYSVVIETMSNNMRCLSVVPPNNYIVRDCNRYPDHEKEIWPVAFAYTPMVFKKIFTEA